MKRLIILPILYFLLFCFYSAPKNISSESNDSSEPPVIEEIIKEAEQKTVILYQQENIIDIIGCGVLLRNNVIATNWHLIRPFYIKGSKKQPFIKAKIQNELYEEISIIGVDPLYDIAFLKVITPHKLPFFNFASDYFLQEPIICIGMPHGHQKFISKGRINQINIHTNKSEINFYDFFYHNAPIWYGSSGGPIINYQGELVGMNVFMVTDKNNKFQKWSYWGVAVSNKIIEYLLDLSERGQRQYNPSPPCIKTVWYFPGLKIIQSDISQIEKGDIIVSINELSLADPIVGIGSRRQRGEYSPEIVFEEIMQFSKGGEWRFVLWRNFEKEGPLQIITIDVKIY